MSPSRIEQIASEMKREQERKQQEQERKSQSMAREAAERERQEKARRDREESQRVNVNIEKGRSILTNTGILSHLTELKDSLDPYVRKTIFLVDYTGDTANVRLAWGSKLAVEYDRITGESGFFSARKSDYSCIAVELDIKSESFRICDTYIDSNTWKNDPNTLIEALAEAYQNPYRNVDRYVSYSSSSSSSDYNTECCNS